MNTTLNAIVVIFVVAALVLLAGGPGTHPTPTDPTADPVTDATVKAWLECQRKGQLGYEHWADEKLAFALYGVSNYEVVHCPSAAHRVVRINHATRSGTPKVHLFSITVCNGKIVTAVQQGE